MNLRQKIYPILVQSLFENTMGFFFFTFLNVDQKSLKKNFRIKVWTFQFQMCFRNQSLTSGSHQTENTQIRVFAYFQFDYFPKFHKLPKVLQSFTKRGNLYFIETYLIYITLKPFSQLYFILNAVSSCQLLPAEYFTWLVV